MMVRGEDDFGVRFRFERIPQPFQFDFQLKEVIHLAVEYDPIPPIGIRHRLPPAIGRVYDREAAMPQPKI